MKRERIALIICPHRVSISINNPIFVLSCYVVIDVFIQYIFLPIYQLLSADLFSAVNRILIGIEFFTLAQGQVYIISII